MNEKPFFSAVIPLYNKAGHVERSLSSVLNQTFQDFELIIINDASTDGSIEEVQKFSDPRIKIYHRSAPGPGGYAARNLGIKKAKGEWIAFLDADDEWYPEHLEKMKDLSYLFPEVYFMGCGWHKQQNNTKKEDEYFKKYQIKGPHIIDAKTYLKRCLDDCRPVHTSIACVKRESPVLPDLFPANKKTMRGGDLHAWLRIICFHKLIAWNNHIGGIYFRDSVNMVTKTAPSQPDLINYDVFNELATFLTKDEKKLLKKYFNIRLRDAWIGNIQRGSKNFFLPTKLYWSGDFCTSTILFLMFLLPRPTIKLLLSVRRRLR